MEKKMKRISVFLSIVLLFSSCLFACGEPTPVYEISLNTSQLYLKDGESDFLSWTVKKDGEEDIDSVVTLTSDHPEIAEVSQDGTITGVSGGVAVITASVGGASATVEVVVTQMVTAQQVNSFSEKYINIYGRSYISSGALRLDHSANAVEVGVNGSALSVNLTTNSNSYMQVFVDGEEKERIKITPATSFYTVASGLSDGYHKIRLVKDTEMAHAMWTLKSFSADEFIAVEEKSDLKIEFLGDSISAGHGAIGTSAEKFSVDNSACSKSYTYLTAQALNCDYSIISWSGIAAKAFVWGGYRNMLNLYPLRSSASETPYDFSFNPDIVVINLGTNESSYLRLPDGKNYGSQFPYDYEELLEFVREKNPSAKIICLYGAMGVNSTIESGIKTAIDRMNDDNIVYNPITVLANTQGASAHPTAEAQKTNADALVQYIKSL